jgi:hypothetical protein
MTGFLASHKLFSITRYAFCEGVIVHSNKENALKDTMRHRNIYSLNQWFRISCPGENTFLSLDSSMKEQPGYVIEHLTGEGALKLPFIKKGREFMAQLEMYLAHENASDNPLKAKMEIAEFYTRCKNEVLAMTAQDYLAFLSEQITGRDPAKQSSYLYHSGITGLSFPSEQNSRSYLLFNPRRDAIIKEIGRAPLNDTRMVS